MLAFETLGIVTFTYTRQGAADHREMLGAADLVICTDGPFRVMVLGGCTAMAAVATALNAKNARTFMTVSPITCQKDRALRWLGL